MKKKVLYILDTLSLGGAELSLIELAKNLSEFEPIICVIYKAPQFLKPQVETLGIKLIFLNITKRFGFLRASILVKNIVKEEKPNLVHATHFRSEIISRIAVPSFNIPLIGTFISDTYSKERYSLVSKREKIKLELYRYLNKATAFRCSLFISVSEAIVKPNQKYLGIPSRKIRVIPNGRDVEKYNQANPVLHKNLYKGLKDSDVLIISNSRVIKSKGFNEMLKAFQLLIKENLPLYLVVVGGGEHYNYYKLLCIEYEIQDRVFFLGNRIDMPEILKACDIFWFASHYEGSPGVLIEGMLSQLPIIASNISPVTENLIDGENALLFSKGDAEGLANKTRFLLENWSIKGEMTKKAYQLAINKFDIKQVAAKHEKVYNEMISGKK